MKFDIFSDNEWKRLDVESYPQLTDTLDESFDTCQIVLKANRTQTAIAPDQMIRAMDNGFVRHFAIMSDEVTVASASPLMYRHTLTLAQNISKWKKFLIRNQVFSQPPSDVIMGKCSTAIMKTRTGLDSVFEPYVRAIPFDGHMKVGRVQVRWGFRDTYWNGTEYRNAESLGEPKGSIWIESETGVQQMLGRFPDIVDRIPRGDWRDLGEEYSSKIRALASLGAVKVIFRSGYQAWDDDFSGVPTDSNHPAALITFSFEVRCEVYYFSMWDVLSQLRDSCAQFIGHDARKPVPYEMPAADSKFGARLKSTIAPNFTWTQSTLYDALADFFSYYDAIMTLDEDNVIGIEEMKPNGQTVKARQVGYSSMSSSEERANGMVNFYSRAKRTISVPDAKGSFMGLRSESIGVPAQGDISIVLPDPIDHITKAEIVIKGFRYSILSGSGTPWMPNPWDIKTDVALDITDRFVEQSVWNVLPKDHVTNDDRRYDISYQQTTIPYSKGSKSISVSKTFKIHDVETYFLSWMLESAVAELMGMGTDKRYDIATGYEVADTTKKYFNVTDPDVESITSSNWDDIRIRIEYVAQTEGKVRIESEEYKVEREIISSQGGADCDMGKLAENMQGLIRRIGNESRTVTFEIDDWANTPRKGQSIGRWVISKIDYRITPSGKYVAVAELSKDFNRLSMRTKIDRSKRMTNVSNDLVQDCEDILTEYVYLTLDENFPKNDIAINQQALDEMMSNTIHQRTNTRSVDLASFESKNRIGSVLASSLSIPMRRYDFGNCICFEMRYDSPISAGNEMHSESGWFGYTAYYSEPVLYSDAYGFFETANIKLMSSNGHWASSLPWVDQTQANEVGEISEYLYMKKPNERFGLNYEVCFLTDPRAPKGALVLGKAFFENNGLLGKGNKGSIRVYHDSDVPYTDGKASGSYAIAENVASTGEPFGHSVRANIQEDMVSNWAIADGEGNVLIACNIPQKLENKTIKFYLAPSKWRL